MKKIIYIISVVAIVLSGCSNHTPQVPVSNNLEIALGDNYDSYVNLLNKSVKCDTVALVKFMKINNLNDAAGYDHGYILYKLLEIVGDKKFSSTLKELTPKETRNLANYFDVGIDANDRLLTEFQMKYPLSYKCINSVK